MADSKLVSQILSFWFGESNSPDYGKPREFWFKSTPNIDQYIRDTFGKVYEQAKKGELDHLKNTPEGFLSLVIILDQFPRNMFRSTSQSFGSDTKALEVSKEAILKGFDQQLPSFQRGFLYLPFMHSESIEDHEQSLIFYEAMGNVNMLDYAHRHRDIIARYGRFPHRNAILKRQSTPEEIEFLNEPGSSF